VRTNSSKRVLLEQGKMIVIIDADRQFRARVIEQLGRRDAVAESEKLADLERLVEHRDGKPAVVILGPSTPATEALHVAERMQVTAPDVSVVLVVGSLSSEILQSALRAGVRDVLPEAFTPQQLIDTIVRCEMLAQQLMERQGPVETPDGEKGTGKLITVFSSKGGCGKSFVASNLAILLAQRTGQEVAMVDLDLQFGDLAIMLQLFPARTIYDAAQNLDRLDAEALRGYLTPHRQGVYLLAAPLEPGLSETITADQVKVILKMLTMTFPFVIVDSPPSFTDHVLAALDESAECVLVMSMDVPSIKNLKLALQTLELLGFGRDRIRLVLNRADSKVGLRVQEVEKTLGTSVDVAIPSSREVPLSINRGTPLVTEDPKSPVVSALAKLVDAVGAESKPRSAEAPRSRFRLGRG
ncbi:MAG: CpaE family protein, partial [Actinomycetota bacterium]